MVGLALSAAAGVGAAVGVAGATSVSASAVPSSSEMGPVAGLARRVHRHTRPLRALLPSEPRRPTAMTKHSAPKPREMVSVTQTKAAATGAACG
ncbi:hypothetical protein DFH06DRAFT_1232529 [Mycena polygramma]|nr:hypothetical protein DFH06DRAFT_1239904 [Mycena polygramma]KAJ7621705.1 hypothetical protein DFH06DRAFT_1232529 [Mycena polygramma]